MTPDHSAGLRSPIRTPQLFHGDILQVQHWVFITHQTYYHPACSNFGLKEVIIWPFGTYLPICLIFCEGNGNSVSHQPLGLIPSFLCCMVCICYMDSISLKTSHPVWWPGWPNMGIWVLKSGVHATAYYLLGMFTRTGKVNSSKAWGKKNLHFDKQFEACQFW
jgi:hypothetical protein